MRSSTAYILLLCMHASLLCQPNSFFPSLLFSSKVHLTSQVCETKLLPWIEATCCLMQAPRRCYSQVIIAPISARSRSRARLELPVFVREEVELKFRAHSQFGFLKSLVVA